MKTRVAGLLLLTMTATAGARTAESLPRCKGLEQPATESAPVTQVGNEFVLALPACFVPDTEAPRYIHGGQRWRCEGITLEVVWGMWGEGSFDEESKTKCVTRVLGLRVVLVPVDRGAEKPQAIAWYRTGQVHEPLVSAWSDDNADAPRIERLVLSGRKVAKK